MDWKHKHAEPLHCFLLIRHQNQSAPLGPTCDDCKFQLVLKVNKTRGRQWFWNCSRDFWCVECGRINWGYSDDCHVIDTLKNYTRFEKRLLMTCGKCIKDSSVQCKGSTSKMWRRKRNSPTCLQTEWFFEKLVLLQRSFALTHVSLKSQVRTIGRKWCKFDESKQLWPH